jgi:hypothetical protein
MLQPKQSSLQPLATEDPLQMTENKDKNKDKCPAAYLEAFCYKCPPTDKPAGNLNTWSVEKWSWNYERSIKLTSSDA